MTAAQNSITKGGLFRPLLKLTWPVVVTQLLQVTYNIVDTLWLGRLSADAVGAISLTFPLTYLLISVGGGFSVAGNTLVAQYIGADSEQSAGKVATQALVFTLLLGIIFGILGHVTTNTMLLLFPSEESTKVQIIPLASEFMEVYFLGLPFIFGYYIFSALMRGYGDTRLPMYIMGVSVLINLLLDPVFIFGWGPVEGHGIAGAAAATVLSRAIATALGVFVLFFTGYGPDVTLGYVVPDPTFLWELVRIGVPSALEESQSALAMITLTTMVVTFPPAVVAAYGFGSRVTSVVFLPARGLGRATNTMVGQNLGMNQTRRAERAVWLAVKTSVAILLVFSLVAVAFSDSIVRLFIITDTQQAAETIRYGNQYLHIRAVEFAFLGVLEVILGAFRGAGNTRTALLFGALTKWVGRVPMTYVLAFPLGLGATGLWAGKVVGDIFGALAAMLWFSRGTWKRAVVETGGESSQTRENADD